MPKENKMAKMGHNKKKQVHEVASSNLVILSGPHLVNKHIDLLTSCGQRRVGWRYGEESDVACRSPLCSGVPAGQFEPDEALKELGV